MKKIKIDYESAMNRLRDIVEKLGEGNINLDEAVNLYEEGVALILQCRNILNDVSKRIDLLRKNAEGELELNEIDISEEDVIEDKSDDAQKDDDTLF